MNFPAMAASTPPDDERLYRFLQQEAWLDALDWLHGAWRRLGGDERALRAAEVFDAAFFADLEARPQEALERRLMLHHGQMRALERKEHARITTELARRRQEVGDEAAVRALARLMDETRPPGPEKVVRRSERGGEDRSVRVTRVSAVTEQPDARRSLFKSEQEHIFFEALRDVFPTHLVYPNAALSATLDFDRLAGALTSAERRYFFRAVVDAVVVDPLEEMRPVFFFELDSALHDTAERREKDRLKEHILARAGQVLFRVRSAEAGTERTAFARALQSAVEEASENP